MSNERITPDHITELRPNEVFVFGSNRAGLHAGGAAKTALKWGAIMGEGEGLHGQTYAIPTLDVENGKIGGPLKPRHIRRAINDLSRFAYSRPDLVFFVTKIGCGIAGFTPEEIAPMFGLLQFQPNVYLPREFLEILGHPLEDDHA